jgi:hypothetical protein
VIRETVAGRRILTDRLQAVVLGCLVVIYFHNHGNKSQAGQPGSHEGKRDFLTVETWLYEVEQYSGFVQIDAPEKPINDAKTIAYASSLFKQTAANWWYILV